MWAKVLSVKHWAFVTMKRSDKYSDSAQDTILIVGTCFELHITQRKKKKAREYTNAK